MPPLPPPEGFGLLHARVLDVLKDGGLLSRARIAERAGFTERSGSLSRALHGHKVNRGNRRARPGLIEMGLVQALDLDIDGLTERNYRITAAGRAALRRYLHYKTEDGTLPPVPDREPYINKRYRKPDPPGV